MIAQFITTLLPIDYSTVYSNINKVTYIDYSTVYSNINTFLPIDYQKSIIHNWQ